ncbi:MAG: protein kinase [Gemmataceae bacterium]
MPEFSCCPDPALFARLAAGQLSAGESEALLAHLERCPTCSTLVGGLAVNDTLAELLREARPVAGEPPDGRVAELIARLSRARPEETPSSHADAEVTADTAQLPSPVAAGERFPFLAPSQAADELGRVGPYRVLEVVGTGGMGVVFRAEDPHLRRPVALKVMLPVLAANETARARFLREAQACAGIRHDHIVAVYQVGDTNGVPYLAMEFLDGETLDSRLHREGKLPTAEVVRIGREMAQGMAAAHKRGLIHRDIKPANVWLEAESGRVKILDFGLARSAGQDAALTHQGAIVGTPAYMAPEQGQGKPVDPRADLFSLGCVLYRMAAGQAPFVGTDLISTLMAVSTQHPPSPRQLNTTVPAELSDLIMSLLAKEPDRRPSSAAAVIERLDRIPIAPIAKSRPHRRRWIAAAAVALLLAGLAGLGASGVLRLKTKDGTIVMEGLPADAKVLVDGDAATIEPGGAGGPIVVRTAPGERQLVITAAGFEMKTQDVTLRPGERKPLRIRLEPLAVAAALPMTAPDPDRRAAGGVSLFNGKDLAGWQTYAGSTDGWQVVDGQMIGRFSEYLLYHPGREFADLYLRIEYKVTPNTMLHLVARSSFTPHWPQNSYRLNLGFDPTDLQQSGSVHRWIPIGVESHKPDEWVTAELILRGTRLETRINGRKLGERTHAWFRSGVIGLRVATAGGTAAIRKLEVRPLPPLTPPRTPTVGRAVALFDGRGFGDFRTYAGDTKGWELEDGCLVSRGDSPYLYSRLGDYRDFTLQAEVQVSDNAAASIGLLCPRVPDGEGPEHYCLPVCAASKLTTERTGSLTGIAPVTAARHRPNNWAILEATCRGDRLTVRVNGETTVYRLLDRRFHSGHVMLANKHAGTFKVRRLTIQEYAPVDPTGDADRKGPATAFEQVHGATQAALLAWAAELPPKFRPMWVAVRTGTKETLFDAVARPDPTVKDWRLRSLTAEETGADYDVLTKEGFRPALICTYNTTGLGDTRIYVKDDRPWANWFGTGGFMHDIAKDALKKDDPPSSLCVKEHNDGLTYEMTFDDSPGTPWQMHLDLSPAELAKLVADYRAKGWRPHIVNLHHNRTPLRYLAVFVENKTKEVWQFATDLSPIDYDRELTRRRTSGGYPRCVCSYEQNGKVGYTVVWNDGPTDAKK